VSRRISDRPEQARVVAVSRCHAVGNLPDP